MDLLKSVLSSLDIATSILILILLLGAWVLWKVQQNPHNDFRFEEMLRDDSGKPSAFRLAVFVSLAVSTWIIMFIVLKTNSLDTWMYVTYLGIWSGAKVAETALVAYSASRGRPQRSMDNEEDKYNEISDDQTESNRQEPRYLPPRR